MTDRELLELAAKAAGMNTPRYVIEGRQLGWAINEGVLVESGPTSQRLWNPLTDDGDALRLAVTLRMAIDIGGGGFAHAVCGEPECAEAQEGISLDPYAAARRAIVRAAADLGKRMS